MGFTTGLIFYTILFAYMFWEVLLGLLLITKYFYESNLITSFNK